MTEEVTTYTTVAANPGWLVALYLPGDDAFEFHVVIGWIVERFSRPFHRSAGRDPDEMCVSTHTVPLLCGIDLDQISNHWAVKEPYAGRYEFPEDRSFGTEADALAYCREQLARRRATARTA